jgi:DNA-binding MarR family transcriptional regulator
MRRTAETIEPPIAPGDELNPARLRIAVGRMARWLRPTAAAGALTATEVDVLLVAMRRGPARMSDIASFCGVNPTMLSRMVPRLEAAGLLGRQVDESDKRAWRIAATAKSHRLVEKVLSEREGALTRLLAELSPEDRAAIAAATPVLEKLSERLRAEASPAR